MSNAKLAKALGWKAKLHPARFSDISPKMAAIIGAVVDEKFTDPQIECLYVTSDGFVLAQMMTGDIGANAFIGSIEDLRSNWNRLMVAAGLTRREMILANKAFEYVLVKPWGR